MRKIFLLLTIILFANLLEAQTPPCFSTFGETHTFSLGWYSGQMNANAIIKDDFNNDGILDLATSNSGSWSISILLGTGTGSYAAAINYNVSSSPLTLCSADLNNDGKKDIAVLSASAISIFLGTGGGNFASGVNYGLSYIANSIVAKDFDADGNIDLVLSAYAGVYIIKGNGTGAGWWLSQNISTLPCLGLTPKDFNNDTKLDLAVCHYDSTLSVLFGVGTGSFVPSVTNNSFSGKPMILNSSDLNGDGNYDLAVCADNGLMSILLGSTSGTFTSAFTYSTNIPNGSNGTTSIILSDVNKDSKLDLLTSSRGIGVFLGQGNGSFSQPTYFNTGNFTCGVEVVDYNSDGNVDLAILENGNDQIRILPGYGNGNFTSNVICETDTFPVVVVACDFNGDSKQDLATWNYTSKNISLLIGNGLGEFAPAVSIYSLSVNDYVNSLNSGDINNDGYSDLLITCESVHHILFGNSAGTLSVTTTYTVPMTISTAYFFPIYSESADFNGDGNEDIAVAGSPNPNSLGSRVYILLGNGLGAFTTPVSYTVSNVSNVGIVKAVDLNSDGYKDLAVTTNSNICVLLGNSAGTFTNPVIYNTLIGANNLASTLYHRGLTLGDFDNDGDIDVAVYKSGKLAVLLGDNTGHLYASADYTITTFGGQVDVITCDINGDANLDLVTGVFNNGDPKNAITILLGDGTGIFNTTIDYDIGSSVTSIVSADFDGDAKIDLAATNPRDNHISVLLNKPTIVLSSTYSICIGTSAHLAVSGASSYTWNTGATTSSIIVTPTTTSIYTVTVTDLNSCGNTQTVSVLVNNACQDVWPGDANSDGIADNIDVLELGLHYTQTGAPRANNSNSWQPYSANNWTGIITNGKNLNHSDCNGDGAINDGDTLAIYNNYGLTHAFKTAQTTMVNPQLSIIPDQATVVKGTWGTASIYLGDATTNINNINGLAFIIDFDNTLIEPSNIWIEYLPSFIDASQNLHFRKLDFANSKLFTASTHTVSNNVSGFGKIAILHYQIKSSLTTDQVLNIGLSQANQSNASGTITPLTSGTGTLMAIGASVGLQELNGNVVSISPNPTNGSLTIYSKTELQKIEVVSVTGQTLLCEMPTNVSHTLHLDNFANGIYFVNLYQDNRIVKREKIVLNK